MEKKKNPAAVRLANLRAKSLSPERRVEIATKASKAAGKAMSDEDKVARARKAAAARWGKKKAVR